MPANQNTRKILVTTQSNLSENERRVLISKLLALDLENRTTLISYPSPHTLPRKLSDALGVVTGIEVDLNSNIIASYEPLKIPRNPLEVANNIHYCIMPTGYMENQDLTTLKITGFNLNPIPYAR